MLSQNREIQSFEAKKVIFPGVSNLDIEEETLPGAAIATPIKFYSHFNDCMELYAPAETVANYLNNHASWFCRTAEPMTVQSLGENGYALVIGKFGAFGYDVEPKVGLELLPAEAGIYKIQTIPVPDYQAPGYEVDFNASLKLVETPETDMTGVEWDLCLTVYIQFPKFIQRLPKSLIESTGDKLISQIIRQVSRRLTRKVQLDFHQSLAIPFPRKKRK
jgi:Protein of unknown function (DUF1997)